MISMYIQPVRSIDDLKNRISENLDELLLEAVHQDDKYVEIDEYIKDRMSLTLNDLGGKNNESNKENIQK